MYGQNINITESYQACACFIPRPGNLQWPRAVEALCGCRNILRKEWLQAKTFLRLSFTVLRTRKDMAIKSSSPEIGSEWTAWPPLPARRQTSLLPQGFQCPSNGSKLDWINTSDSADGDGSWKSGDFNILSSVISLVVSVVTLNPSIQ